MRETKEKSKYTTTTNNKEISACRNRILPPQIRIHIFYFDAQHAHTNTFDSDECQNLAVEGLRWLASWWDGIHSTCIRIVYTNVDQWDVCREKRSTYTQKFIINNHFGLCDTDFTLVLHISHHSPCRHNQLQSQSPFPSHAEQNRITSVRFRVLYHVYCGYVNRNHVNDYGIRKDAERFFYMARRVACSSHTAIFRKIEMYFCLHHQKHSIFNCSACAT